jgi:hypothetical protein
MPRVPSSPLSVCGRACCTIETVPALPSIALPSSALPTWSEHESARLAQAQKTWLRERLLAVLPVRHMPGCFGLAPANTGTTPGRTNG